MYRIIMIFIKYIVGTVQKSLLGMDYFQLGCGGHIGSIKTQRVGGGEDPFWSKFSKNRCYPMHVMLCS